MSPFYNPSLSKLDLIRNVAFRSNTRLNRFSHSLSLLSNENYKSIILPNNGDYLMRIFIGTPPIEKLAIFDPGSDLTWVRYNVLLVSIVLHKTPHYMIEPNLPLIQISHVTHNLAHYSLKNNNFVENHKNVFTHTIMSIFGCGYYNIFTADNSGKAAGLVGLGAGPFSLVSQLGHSIGRKFSYCLVPFGSNSTSKLKFGNQSTITGNEVVSTPLIIKSLEQTFYYLNLEGITIGRQKTIQTGQIDGNIIIDSGTALMYLEQPFFDDFLASVKEVIDIEEVEDIPSPFHYCFEDPNSSFPSIVLHFTGANVPLQPKNILYLEENNLVCLAVVPSNIAGISILGNLAQIDFQVEYDLEGKKLSFSPSDCTKN
ncbi:putative nepenthesin [Medicago truncatula]|uniref:Putative nepenthesin n=1 Tax=Medicago truncatula TaxID=3880 RepID=A0A396JTP3_MEDTR|nr:putative nepenthesin [Medicago truncatula]